MKPGLLRFSVVIALLLLSAYNTFATHLRAGEITVVRDECNNLKFWITITVFTNTIETNVLFGGEDDILDFGDGSDPDGDGRPGIKVPETQNTLRPDLGEGIATASFTIDHIYASASNYLVSYSEPNRNEGVLNMDGSVNTRFYIETRIVIDPFFGCNENTPRLKVPPIDRGCTGVKWFHNPGAYDLDGDSLSYELVIPFRERNTTVANYRSPAHPNFYLTPSNGTEDGLGAATFTINSVDGTIEWDAPGRAGEYNIAFVIKEWRNINGRWVPMGFVRRDMQIIIEDCDNKRPDLIVPEDVCVEAGTVLDAEILGIDPDGDSVRIEAFSEIFDFPNPQSPATYSFTPTPDKAGFQPQPGTLNFQWQTQCSHVKDQPYLVVFKVTDLSNSGPSLATFKTWRIRVVGPPPQWATVNPVDLNQAERTVTLDWDPYFCQNANEMQVWRRVDSLAFEPDSCMTGMPESLGYELVETVPASTTTYVDGGLAPGAVYCYRLVALFPAPRGGESYVSTEVCVPPILVDAAVITNVSVNRTGLDDGEITVRWVPPFQADPVAFPAPYSFQVYRAEGETSTDFTLVSGQNTITDSSFVDTGLNTETNVYRYLIRSFASNNAELDSSAVANSVRLQARPEVDRINLSWYADVPWSNNVQGEPHIIYRGAEGSVTPEQLDSIASVDVVELGLNFIDSGAFNNVPLETGMVYCYVVKTRGSYGSDVARLANRQPFENFSQVLCAELGDTIPPCPVVVTTEAIDCATANSNVSTCQGNTFGFQNTISWTASTSECAADIAYYNVYFRPFSNVDSSLLATNVRETTFTHQGLTSKAGCYQVTAVDRSGNEGPVSEMFCIDNCPYYELPNVFSPNGDGCNDLFSAFSDRDPLPDNPELWPDCYADVASRLKCARFVNSVVFTVYNRWGKALYKYESQPGSENSIFIDWNGKSTEGIDLPSGVYYYQADVSFVRVDPNNQVQTFKGWVHLIR